MAAGHSAEARAIRTPCLESSARWQLVSVVWALVAFATPLNNALPPLLRAVWFGMIFGGICASVLLMRVVQAIYPFVWIFAGYASLVAVVTATDVVTISDNLFVGAQLFVLLGLAPFALTYNAISDSKFVRRVGIAYLIGQTLSAFVAILQLMGQTIDVPGAVYGAVYGRAAGLAEHPTTLGLMSCIGVLLSLRILLVTRKFRLLVLIALAANLLSLVASGSLTSAIMGLAVGVVVLMVCEREYLGRMVIWGIGFTTALGLAVAVTGVADYLPSLSDRFSQVTSTSETGSWSARLRTFEFAWIRVLADPIFGEGLNPVARGTYNGITTVHNSVLRAWYQGGILLGIAFALIFVATVIIVGRSMAKKENGCEASILIAIFAYAMVSPLLEQRHLWLPVLICWASISAAKVNATRQTPPPSHASH